MSETNSYPDSNVTAGAHTSYWLESVDPIVFEKLSQNISTDVVIVGGYSRLKRGIHPVEKRQKSSVGRRWKYWKR